MPARTVRCGRRPALDMEVLVAVLFPCAADVCRTVAAGSITNGQMALLAVVAILTTLTLLAGARRRREGGPSPKAYAREQVARIKEERAVREDVADVMVQLEQLARELNAQLDNRFVKLERVIADADDRMDRLERLMHQAWGTPKFDVTIGDDGSGQEQPAEAPGQGSWRERALELHDQGQSASDIANMLGRPAGEIELLIALPRRKETAPTQP